MGSHKISFLILGNQKWKLMAYIMFASHVIARSYEIYSLM